jgi:hypothetical protein
MVPYVMRYVSKEDVNEFNEICRLIHRLPNPVTSSKGEKITLNCHILCRVIGELFSLQVVDGLYNVIYRHSWLLNKKRQIIDVYPVATLGGPLLIDAPNLLLEKLYEEKKIQDDFTSPVFQDHLAQVRKQVVILLATRA